MRGSPDDEGTAQYPPTIKDETLKDMRRTQYPTNTRATLRRSSSSSPEVPSGTPRPQTNNVNAMDYRDNQDSFRDVLDTEPVLSEGNPGIYDKSDEDEGAGDHSHGVKGPASTSRM